MNYRISYFLAYLNKINNFWRKNYFFDLLKNIRLIVAVLDVLQHALEI